MFVLRYVALFLTLGGFSAVSLGSVRPSGASTGAAQAMHAESPEWKSYVVMNGLELDWSGLSASTVTCPVSEEQADRLLASAAVRLRWLPAVGGGEIRILYLPASRENRRVVGEILGGRLEDAARSRVVQDDWVLPLLTPTFVS